MKLAAAEASAQMLGICWNCSVDIGRVVIDSHIFITEAADYEYLLGMPYEIAARVKTKTADDGSQWIHIFSCDGNRSVQYCGV